MHKTITKSAKAVLLFTGVSYVGGLLWIWLLQPAEFTASKAVDPGYIALAVVFALLFLMPIAIINRLSVS